MIHVHHRFILLSLQPPNPLPPSSSPTFSLAPPPTCTSYMYLLLPHLVLLLPPLPPPPTSSSHLLLPPPPSTSSLRHRARVRDSSPGPPHWCVHILHGHHRPAHTCCGCGLRILCLYLQEPTTLFQVHSTQHGGITAIAVAV